MTKMDEARRTTVLDDELRPFGRWRQWWQSHPRIADALITFVAVFAGNPVMVVFMSSIDVEVPRPLLIAMAIVSTLAGVSLLWRRSRPVLVFTSCVIGMVAATFGGFSVSVIAAMVALYSVAVYRAPRIGWACLTGATVVFAAALIGANLALGIAREGILPYLIVMVVCLLVALLLGSNVYGVRRYQNALIERARQLEVESDQRAELARSAERGRIAREMHDVVSHSLTVVVALAEGASATPDRDRAVMATDTIAKTARNALTEMRSMLGVLRSDDDHAPLAPTTPESIESIVSMARDAGFPVTLKTTGINTLSGSAALAVSRIVQEALTNAMRHSDAAAITVSLWHTAADTVIAVENDYPRPQTKPAGFGLRGLQERAQHVGGSLTAGPSTHGTWRVDAMIPHRPAEENRSDE